MTYALGHRYIGNWQDGKKHGRGTMEYNDGNIYEGDWYQDQRHGRGKFIWNKLDVARMEFYDGQVRYFFVILSVVSYYRTTG